MVHLPTNKAMDRTCATRRDGFPPMHAGVIGADLHRLTVKNTFYDCAVQDHANLRRIVSEPAAHAFTPAVQNAAWKQPMKVLPSLQEGHMASFPQQSIAPLSALFADEALMDARLSESLKVDDYTALWPATPESHFLPPGLTLMEDAGPPGVATLPRPTGPLPTGLIMGSDFVRLPTPSTLPQAPVADEVRFGKSTSIAELQELLQSTQQTTHFRCPPGAQVLQWSYKQRTVGRVMFRAVVAFLHDGVAKHVAGGWGSSKKGARQSAAELALSLLHGEEANVDEGVVYVDTTDLVPAGNGGASVVADFIDILRQFCDERFGTGEDLVWRCDSAGSKGWSATVKVAAHGVAHTMRGPPCESPEAACAELARRVLWYLGSPSLIGCYYPDSQAILASNCKVNDPSVEWTEALSAVA